jgi:hypothetical protein
VRSNLSNTLFRSKAASAVASERFGMLPLSLIRLLFREMGRSLLLPLQARLSAGANRGMRRE